MGSKIGIEGFVADDRYEVVCALEMHDGSLEMWRHDIVGFAVDNRDLAAAIVSERLRNGLGELNRD